MDWAELASQKQKKRLHDIEAWGLAIPENIAEGRKLVKHIPRSSGVLSDTEVRITDASPTEILRKVSGRSWSAETVVRAFISRAIIAHYLTNPLTELFFHRAIERAQELDRYQKGTGKVVGPLHGLPISLKDTIHVAGQESTQGYIGWIGNVQECDDSVVRTLHQAGAVFYCKTNVPQTLMSGECVNFIFGRTSSPWNTTLSAGGSSGGEGSLVALGGSPLGVGSDIAGSIRTPANFNGIYGLCPSTGRLPGHCAEKARGDKFITPVFGPLCRGVDGLELYTRAVLSMQPWLHDHQVLRIPWREQEYQEGLGCHHRLSFAFMSHDGTVLPDPPIQRCMTEFREKVRRAGHDTIDIQPFDGAEIMAAMVTVFGATGGRDIREVLKASGEPLIKEVEFTDSDTALSAWEYKRAGAQIGILRQKYLNIIADTASKTASGRPVDAIILPSGGHVAPPHSTMEYYTYEAISNALDWTCATIPVGFVDATLDKKPEPFVPMSDEDARNHAKYSPEAYENGPVCLQVMGGQHCEEKVLGILRVLDAALGRSPLYQA